MYTGISPPGPWRFFPRITTPPTSEAAVLVLESTHQSLRTHTRELSQGRPWVSPCFGQSYHLGTS